jgi:hypothetical protein
MESRSYRTKQTPARNPRPRRESTSVVWVLVFVVILVLAFAIGFVEQWLLWKFSTP